MEVTDLRVLTAVDIKAIVPKFKRMEARGFPETLVHFCALHAVAYQKTVHRIRVLKTSLCSMSVGIECIFFILYNFLC
jgi:hypothetical protein